MHQLEPTKERIDRLIDSLADKSMKEGCLIRFKQKYIHNFLTFDKGDVVRYLGHDKYGVWIQVAREYHNGTGSEPFQIILSKLKFDDYFDPSGSPVRIGDVLAKLYNEKGLYDMCTAEEILDEWRKCGAEEKNGLLLSLQEIFDCEWLGPELNGYEVRVGDEKENYPLIFPEDPNIRALASLLLTLFPDV